MNKYEMRQNLRRAPLAVAIGLVALLASPAAARADTITVTRADDRLGPNDAPGCTLREAISDAHLLADNFCESTDDGHGRDRVTIELPLSVELTIKGGFEDRNVTGDLDIGDDVGPITEPEIRIVGTGAAPSVIRQTTRNRVIDLHAGSLELENVVVTGGHLGPPGGGIRVASDAALTLRRSTVADNSAGGTGGDGGGIAIFADARVELIESTVSENHSSRNGGGIYANGPASLSLTNSTVSRNSASFGGGIYFGGPGVALEIEHSTVVENSAFNRGGGLRLREGGTSRPRGTIIAKNTLGSDQGEGPDCHTESDSALTSQGHNLIGDASGCAIEGETATDIIGEDPQLGPLADNGGPTQTHALNAGSAAIDAAGDCETDFNITEDQRGAARPGKSSTACDIGAYEFQGEAEDVIFEDRFEQ